LNGKDGEWIPIKDAPDPVVGYTAYGTPLSHQQFEKLMKKRNRRQETLLFFTLLKYRGTYLTILVNKYILPP